MIIQRKYLNANTAYSLGGIFIVLSPVLLEYFFNITNSNNSSYSSGILTKHFVKISISILFLTGLINSPLLFLNDLVRKIYLIFLVFSIYAISALDFIHVLLFQSRANSSSFYSVFSTNKAEALEFVLDYSSIQLAGIFIIIVIPLLINYLYTSLFRPVLKRVIFVFYLGAIGIIGFWAIKNSAYNYFKEISAYKFYTSYADYKNEIKELNSADNRVNSLHIKKQIFREPETHIIIIGESTGIYHMQLYGYDRATTPELEKIKNKLIIFKKVKSSSVHTISSLKDLLVLRDSNDIFTSNTLPDLFNQAGYKTYWLSNQEFLGENQTLISSIAKRANKKVFISPICGKKSDGELIPELDKILKENDPQKVIFIHLMGTHLSYHERYPHTFDYFNSKNISPFGDHADSFINHYDNAILYNDHVVSEIIKLVDNFEGINSVVYFSDHGDEVYDFRDFHGHSETLLSKYMNSVPFIFYGNEMFNEVKKEKLIELSNNSEKEFSLKNLSHTLQELYDIESEYFDKSKSFFSKPGQVLCNENSMADSSIFYSQQPFPLFGEKIWVHRVNSIERLNLIQNKFKGIELDVVYANGEFDVRHPPAESSNLSLDDYFSNVKEIHKHYFWLDLKNLEPATEKEIINTLNALTSKYPIKNNIIIETTLAESIPELNDAGYCTSYYLPEMANSNEAGINDKLQEISGNLLRNNPNAISQSIDNYKLMSQYFTNCNKLIWALHLDWNDSVNHERVNTMLKNDTTIKICLVNYQTKGWR